MRRMLIVDGRIHLWEKGTPSPPHRQEPYSAEQAIAAMGINRARVGKVPIVNARTYFSLPKLLHNGPYATKFCNRNIEKTPLCKVDVTLPGFEGPRGVSDACGVDEQKGIRPAGSFAGGSVWSSACRGRLQVTQSEAAPSLSSAGRSETRRRGQPGLEAARPAEQ